jgi:hypothetical protein
MAQCSVACPFCRATTAELVSLFGSQLLLSQYRCAACGSYFEGVRDDRGDAEPAPIAAGGGADDDPRAEH